MLENVSIPTGHMATKAQNYSFAAFLSSICATSAILALSTIGFLVMSLFKRFDVLLYYKSLFTYFWGTNEVSGNRDGIPI